MVVKKKRNKRGKDFSLHIMPFSQIKDLTITERVKKILSLVLGNKVVILQGKLRPEEEIRLIEDTMVMVDHIRGFSGIELAVIDPHAGNSSLIFKLKRGIAKSLIGDNTTLTVVGPASIVKEIKKDPKKLEIYLS